MNGNFVRVSMRMMESVFRNPFVSKKKKKDNLWTFVSTDNGTRTRKSDIPYETALHDKTNSSLKSTKQGSGVSRVRAIAIALYNLERDRETILLKTCGEFKPALTWNLPLYSCGLEVDTVTLQNVQIKTKPETWKSCCFLNH